MFNLESASFGDLAFSSGWFGEHVFAVVASNDRLGVAEHYISLGTSSALYIHEI
jgi:hypothetical protein